MRISYIYIFLTLSAVHNLVYAEVYKWVDENGNVHFSDKPKNKNAKKFIYDPKVIGQDTFKNNNSKKSQNKNLQTNDLDIQRKRENQTYNRNQTEKQKRYCNEAKEDLLTTQNSQLLYNYDKKGKRYFLDEKQRREVLKKKKKIVNKWCGK